MSVLPSRRISSKKDYDAPAMIPELLSYIQNAPAITRREVSKSPPQENVDAVAWARRRDGKGWRLVLSFADRDGHTRQLIVKRSEIIRGDALFELLDDFGFPIPADHRARAML